MRESMAKQVATVGAGVSGLASIKRCPEEGLEPTCFERSDDLGGLWRFTEHVEEGRASLYKSEVSNSCKEMSCYPDFPFPENYPNYVPNSVFLEYLKMYANQFNLLKCIQFKTKVSSVTKCPVFSVTGQWEVVTLHEGKQESAIFDAVMVCTSFLTNPYLPLDSFPEYKHPDIFRDKRVLVIGMGNSGTDIAMEASHVAKKVFLSTRDQLPMGHGARDVISEHVQKCSPNSSCELVDSKKDEQLVQSTQLREPVLSNELPGRIITGKVLIKPSVKEVKENSVVFNNTPKEEPIDIIVFATGYTFAFPFLHETVVKVEDGQASLYKYIFPAHLQKPTLAVIGLIKPLGSMITTGEMQARWAVQVLKGKCMSNSRTYMFSLPYYFGYWKFQGLPQVLSKTTQSVNKLPPSSVMIEEVNARKKKQAQFGLCYCKALQSHYIPCIDELLTYIDAKPNLFSLLLTDPRLALTIFFGPCTPYQFCLTGSGKWEGARNAIMTLWNQTFKVTKTRVVQESPSPFASLLKLFSFLAFLLAIFLIFL
ncbi:hypothetical protein EI555_006405 [Monodon monoceros]|uniref:Flavin-containing monooxygenase n=1 Tax=Monodon monoceros TaxID=40151 RepID=A0A4U1FCC8_MONMO|nr:hypothetical protein EI555_006405 [Monodon monoceros]